MAETTKQMNVQAGNATAAVTATVRDSMPGVPCTGPAGYTYKGLRYVPKFAEPIEWSSANSYEAFTIVMHEGNSYTSKMAVPVGIDILNETFWVKTFDFNAQLETVRGAVASLGTSIENMDSRLQYLTNAAPRKYANTSEMIADSNLLAGMVAFTEGFSNSGDGGAATYIIGNGTANGMDVLNAANGLTANLAYDQVVAAQFGAVSTNNDSSSNIRRAIDVANIIGRYVVFNTPCTVRTPIYLKENDNVNLIGEVANGFCVKAYSHLFVGENLSQNKITNAYVKMTGFSVDFIQPSSYTVFKGVSLLSSRIYNCNFYHFAYFVEGGTQYATRIENCRFQGYSHAVFSSVTYVDGDANARNMNYVQQYYSEHGNLTGCTAVYPFTSKISDENWIVKCYISGTQSQANIVNKTCVLFSTNDPDRDSKINDCWIEFVYYMYRPVNISLPNYGFKFINNVVQYCVNLLQPAPSYINWQILDNRFTAFNATDFKSEIGAVADTFAVILSQGILSNIQLRDNYCQGVDLLVKYSGGNSDSLFIQESGTLNGDYSPILSAKLFDIVYYGGTFAGSNVSVKPPFIYSNVKSCIGGFYADEASLPPLNAVSPKLKNVFADTRFYTPNQVYAVVPTNGYGGFAYKPLGSVGA